MKYNELQPAWLIAGTAVLMLQSAQVQTPETDGDRLARPEEVQFRYNYF